MKKNILNSFTKSFRKDIPVIEEEEEVYLYSEKKWKDEDILELKKREYYEDNDNKNIKKRINNRNHSPERILAINRQLIIDKRKGKLIDNYKNWTNERNNFKLPLPPQAQKGSTKSPRHFNNNNNNNNNAVIEYNLIEKIDDKKIKDINNLILKVKNARNEIIEKRGERNLYLKQMLKEKKLKDKLQEIENKIKHGATIMNDDILNESLIEVKQPLTIAEERLLAHLKLIGIVHAVIYNIRLLKSCKLSFFKRKRSKRILYKFFLEAYSNLKTLKYLKSHESKAIILRNKLQKVRQNRAANLIRLFIWDQTTNNMSVKIRKFFVKVKKCQFILRSFLECSKARRELLHRHWKKIEKIHKKNYDDIIKAKESSKQIQIENRIKKTDKTKVIKKWNQTQEKVKNLLEQGDDIDKSLLFAQQGLFKDNKGRGCNLKGYVVRNLDEDGSMELDIIQPKLDNNDRSSTTEKAMTSSHSQFLAKDTIIRSYIKLKRKYHIDYHSAYSKYNTDSNNNIDSNNMM
jgi:hypothetical protein